MNGSAGTNGYSSDWFGLFLRSIPEERTEREVDPVGGHLPPREYPRTVDLCCGEGRHARVLAERGHEVLGVDLDGERAPSADEARMQFVFEKRE